MSDLALKKQKNFDVVASDYCIFPNPCGLALPPNSGTISARVNELWGIEKNSENYTRQ